MRNYEQLVPAIPRPTVHVQCKWVRIRKKNEKKNQKHELQNPTDLTL